ncbi:MAG: oligosaccharide flippase family protein [Vallitalea sp.]|jgi:O-antigen/teichoic acid export membrane protein|nr:oligosaccharide flippase family protein [Vallitalea sp.]
MKFVKKCLSNTYLNDVFKSLVGTFVFRAVSFIVSIYISKIVGASDYGIFSTIKSFSAVFSAVLCFGFHVTWISYLSSTNNTSRSKELFLNWSVFCVLLLSLTPLVFMYIYYESTSSDFVLNYWWIIFIYALGFSLDRLAVAFLQGYRKYDIFLKLNIISALVYVIVVSLSVKLFGFEIALLVIAIILAFRFLIIYSKYVFKITGLHKIELSLLVKSTSLNMVKKNSFIVFIGEIFYSITQFVSIWILKTFSNYENVGTFALCMLLSNILLFLVSSMSNVFFSHLALKDNILKFFLKNLFLNLLLLGIPFIFLSLNMNLIIDLLGLEYPFFERTMFVILLSILFQVIGVFSEKVLFHYDMIKLTQTLNTIRQILVVLFTMLLLFYWRSDSVGAGVGFLIGTSLIATVKLFCSIRASLKYALQ